MFQFNVNDLVDVRGRRLTNYGIVREVHANGKALVHFRTPRQPYEGRCEYCGFSGMLSNNGATGEVVCLRSGCGGEHGFDERDETIPLDLLINISAKQQEEKKAKFRDRLAALLKEGVNEKFLAPKEYTRILQAL
jgi:hypothetical protein